MDYLTKGDNEKQNANELEFLAHQIYQFKLTKFNNLHPKSLKKINKLSNVTELNAFFKKDKNHCRDNFQFIDGAFSQLKSLKVLQLTIIKNIQITNEGFLSLSKGLLQLPQLESFKFSITTEEYIEDSTFITFSEGIQQMINLSKLGLSLYNIKLSSKRMESLLQAITENKKLSKLTLKLVRNDLNRDTADYLGFKLRKLDQLERLNIQVHKQNVGYAVINQVSQIIKELINLKKVKLNIEYSQNTVELRIEQRLLNGFYYSQNLIKLEVEISRFVPEQIQEVKEKQLQILKTLEELKITFITSQEYDQLSTACDFFILLENLKSLSINFDGKYTFEKQIGVDYNSIKILYEGFVKCKNLKSLRVNTNSEYDYYFISLLNELVLLEKLEVMRNTDIGIKRDVQTNKITELTLFYVQVGKKQDLEQLIYFSDAIMLMKELISVSLYFNDIINSFSSESNLKNQIYEFSDSAQGNIKYFTDSIQNHNSIQNFNVTLIEKKKKNNFHYIKGERIANQNKFSMTVDYTIGYQGDKHIWNFYIGFLSLILDQFNQITERFLLCADFSYFQYSNQFNIISNSIKKLENLIEGKLQLRNMVRDQFLNKACSDLFLGLKTVKFLMIKNSQNNQFYVQLYRKNIKLVILK